MAAIRVAASASEEIAAKTRFDFGKVEFFRGRVIGAGSYGAVCKAKCDQLPCAAKILHTVLFKLRDPGSSRVLKKFEQECQFLRNIRHPNIVQYLGYCRDPESGLPILLMELMDDSLTGFLERQSPSELLPYHVQVNLCHDIALGIAYLHSNAIIHRDLSSNNILLIGEASRAKITDFGMSKLIETSHPSSQLTQCPGTGVYMPPEALRNPPTYSAKLDVFSFGVLTLQIITCKFPDPTLGKKLVEDARYPTGKIEVPIPEIERRKSHIELVEHAHLLLSLLLNCLNDNDKQRPYAKDICRMLDDLKEAAAYEISLKKVTRSASLESKHEVNKEESQRQVYSLTENLRSAEQQLKKMQKSCAQKDERIQHITEELHELRRKLHSTNEKMAEKSSEIHVKVKEFQAMIEAKDKEIKELKQQLKSMALKQEATVATGEKFQLKSIACKQASHKMSRGSLAVEESRAYFRSGINRIYMYEVTNDTWATLPDCPHGYATVSVVNGRLTAVGGWLSREATNKLLTLNKDDNKWVEKLPAMPTKRLLAAAVCAGRLLVVAGGQIEWEGNPVSNVEVMNIDSEQWYIANDLPQPVSRMGAAVCDDRLYLVGGNDQDGHKLKAVFSSSISSLFKLARPYSFGGWLSKTFWAGASSKVWQIGHDMPIYSAAVASVRGQLVAVGGRNGDSAPKASIRVYKPDTDSWQSIGTMQIPRWNAFAAVLKDEKLVIVGGFTSASVKSETDTMEIMKIQ